MVNHCCFDMYVFACSVMFPSSTAPDPCRNFLILELGLYMTYRFKIWDPWIIKLRTLSNAVYGKTSHVSPPLHILRANAGSPRVLFLSAQGAPVGTYLYNWSLLERISITIDLRHNRSTDSTIRPDMQGCLRGRNGIWNSEWNIALL